MPTLHQIQVHPTWVDDCFGCKAATLQLATGEGNASYSAKMDKALDKDRPAYKAMREQGLQPARVLGAAKLQAEAETRFEIESGKILPGQAKEIESAVKAMEDFTGKSAFESSAVKL